MENALLKEAKRLYPKGSLFLSATNNLKSPIKVSELRLSENYKNVVVNSTYGVIFDNGWAEKV